MPAGLAAARKRAVAPCKHNPNVFGDKSFADDLNMERGNVSGREALLPRGAEFHPLFFDLFRYVLKRH